MTAQDAFHWYKCVVASINSPSGNFITTIHSPLSGRKDAKDFEQAAAEFLTPKAWVFYILTCSLRGYSIYIKDLLNSNAKRKIWTELKAFFDSPGRWVLQDANYIAQMLDLQRYSQLKSDILTMKVKPYSYAWLSREIGVDLLRYDDMHVTDFKRKIKLMSQVLTLNRDVEQKLLEAIKQISVNNA